MIWDKQDGKKHSDYILLAGCITSNWQICEHFSYELMNNGIAEVCGWSSENSRNG
jgi:hypothetical protein